MNSVTNCSSITIVWHVSPLVQVISSKLYTQQLVSLAKLLALKLYTILPCCKQNPLHDDKSAAWVDACEWEVLGFIRALLRTKNVFSSLMLSLMMWRLLVVKIDVSNTLIQCSKKVCIKKNERKKSKNFNY